MNSSNLEMESSIGIWYRAKNLERISARIHKEPLVLLFCVCCLFHLFLRRCLPTKRTATGRKKERNKKGRKEGRKKKKMRERKSERKKGRQKERKKKMEGENSNKTKLWSSGPYLSEEADGDRAPMASPWWRGRFISRVTRTPSHRLSSSFFLSFFLVLFVAWLRLFPRTSTSPRISRFQESS